MMCFRYLVISFFETIACNYYFICLIKLFQFFLMVNALNMNDLLTSNLLIKSTNSVNNYADNKLDNIYNKFVRFKAKNRLKRVDSSDLQRNNENDFYYYMNKRKFHEVLNDTKYFSLNELSYYNSISNSSKHKAHMSSFISNSDKSNFFLFFFVF